MNFIQELLRESRDEPPVTKKAHRIYAKIEHRHHDLQQRFRFTLQGIDADWFDRTDFQQERLSLEAFRRARVFIIRIIQESLIRAAEEALRAAATKVKPDAMPVAMGQILASIGEDNDPRWFVVNFAGPYQRSRGAIQAQVHENLGTEGWNQRIDQITPADERTQAKLNSVFRLPEPAPYEVKEVLRDLERVKEPHVVAYDVGQGSANGIHHPNGWVECYFDIGGGVCEHAHTFPTGLQFCFTRQPLIVLSHWHFDHWVSAAYHCPRALQSTWLVPEQSMGPFHFALVLAIWDAGGRVVVWPAANSGIVNAGSISIGRCTGTDRNESGLAMLIKTAAGDVLLPGDCGYENLPDFWSGSSTAPKLLGLVAPHHGGKTSPLGSKKTPEPLGAWSKLAYSVGDPNSYGHVRPDVNSAHIAAGWTGGMTRKTHTPRPAQGHVWLTPVPFIPPCLGGGAPTSCSLQPTQ